MKVGTVYFKDFERLESVREEIDVRPSAFKMANVAYWKNLIADQEVEVRKNTISLIKIKSLSIPSHTIISPLSIMRHALGSVIDIYSDRPVRVEDRKKIVSAAFFAIEDGVVEKGDLIGVVKVFSAGIAPLEKASRISPPSITLTLSTHECNLVYRKNGVTVRERMKISDYWYRRWNIGEWYPVIADENVNVKTSRARVIKVKTVELPPNTIPVPLPIMRHACGTLIDFLHHGRQKKVEESRYITHALFMPVFDGEIRKGDILGILNVYYIAPGERITSLARFFSKSFSGRLVYWRDERTRGEREIEVEPFMFKRSAIGRFEPLIAAETVKIKPNEVQKIRIEPMEFPSGTIVQPLAGRNHAFGVVLDVFSFSPPSRVEEDKNVSHAVFLPLREGEIQQGDLIGALIVYHVSPLLEPEFFLAKHRKVLYA
jgi:hypothetical protein